MVTIRGTNPSASVEAAATVVLVGAFDPRKGIPELVQASMASAAWREHRLFVVGEERMPLAIDAGFTDLNHIIAARPLD